MNVKNEVQPHVLYWNKWLRLPINIIELGYDNSQKKIDVFFLLRFSKKIGRFSIFHQTVSTIERKLTLGIEHIL